MRRKDRECNTPDFLNEVLGKAEVIYLALNSKDDPYCVPVNFASYKNLIYIHGASAGFKLDCIACNNKVAFSTAIDIRVDPSKASTYYKSICGSGTARIITDETEKDTALMLIAKKYSANCYPLNKTGLNNVSIVKIQITKLTGKCCLPK